MFCPHCGKEIAEGQVFCQHCGAKLVEAAPISRPRERTNWEDRESRGFLSGLFTTLNEVLFHPSVFFKKMPVTGGLTDPLLYALIFGMAGLIFSYFWQILLQGAMQGVMIPGMKAAPGQNIFGGIVMAVLAFLSPFLIILGLFITSGILHVCLMLVRGARSGFEATFRVVAYSNSAYIFLVVPFCGSLLAAVWAVVLTIIGLREAHETTGGKAAFAVFLPVVVCCGLVLVAIALFMGAAAASLGTIMQMQK
ncbi:MAG TPA: YIP1 family protein [Nitrospirota bacterium]|nr:YIP1 family protein [Nitrospirota bacterium]